MNRLVTTNLAGVSLETLPPARHEGRLRLLSLGPKTLGFRNYFDQLVEFASRDDEVDAVHIGLRQPRRAKLLTGAVPGLRSRRLDLHAYRFGQYWRWVLHRWLKGPLSLDHFDLVHIFTPECARIVPDLAGRVDARFAVNIDLTVPLRIRELGEWPIGLGPDQRAERRIFHAADLIVCRNAFCSNSLTADYGVSPEKVLVARNSLALPAVSRQDRPPRPADEMVRLVFVGNAWRRKRGDMVIQVHQQRFADVAELHVFSAQAPVDRSARNVVWHGAVAREELLSRWLPEMDIFVLPSRNEGLAWALLEAASVGLPIVATRVAGTPEAVQHEKTGLLVSVDDERAFGDAVQRLIDRPAERTTMGAAGRRYVAETFDAETEFTRLLSCLKSPCGRSDTAAQAATA